MCEKELCKIEKPDIAKLLEKIDETIEDTVCQ